MKTLKPILSVCILLLFCHSVRASQLPTLFIIGDSTVKNHTPKEEGWGDAIAPYFDTGRIRIMNCALGGRSSRSFLNEGLWAKVLTQLKPGDFVMILFGDNDGGPVTGDNIASLHGEGDKTLTLPNTKTGKHEVIHTYGWYLRNYEKETIKAGAYPIVLSPLPRNMWQGNRVNRNDKEYGLWASESAKSEGAAFIDLNQLVADYYDMLGPIWVKHLFPVDHTHTDPIGAELNADAVVQGLRLLQNCPLNKYLITENGPTK